MEGTIAVKPLLEQLKELSAGTVEAEDIWQAEMRRIRDLNSDLHAFITVFETPLRRTDYRRRPLKGVSISVKDLIHIKGYPTTAGSKILRDYVPNYTANIIEGLLKLGASIIGKTNLHEFAFGVTNKNPHYGDCLNPWRKDRISGGSSGGSAVAVATGMSAIALGTDTAGSIRIPASYCGVIGFKPSYGLLSRHGVIPLSWSLDHVGYLGRSVRDIAFLTGLTTEPALFRDFKKSFRASDLRRLRVGIPRNHFLDYVDEDVMYNFEKTIEQLDSNGADVKDVTFPDYDAFRDCRHIIVHAEAAAFHLKMFRERFSDYGEDVRRRLLEGLTVPASSYITALRARGRLLAEFRRLFREVDILAIPTTVITAPRIDAQYVEVTGVKMDVRTASLRNTEVFNVVGAPAISLPNGFSREGLPTSVQLVADINQDWTLLSIAAAVEGLLKTSVSA
jgi:aspartyl-tRNA(Asn)/glutamyl-tRNA(Gln) amidotransferase subunit A